MKPIILLIFLHYPPDQPISLKQYYPSKITCETKGEELQSAWKNIDEDATISWSCKELEELDLS